MLDWLGETKGADLILRAVEAVLAEGQVRTPDLEGQSSTVEVGDAVCRRMERLSTPRSR
jgi:isocitrate/isopropylmalate dehydrogenase